MNQTICFSLHALFESRTKSRGSWAGSLSSGWLFIGIVAVLLATTTGCRNPANPLILEQGRSLVEQSLQAWLDRQSPDVLTALTPSIRFFDDDWNRKAVLLEYEVTETFVEPSDGTARIVVLLKIRQANGRTADVRCAYQVIVEPEIAIARDPMS